MRASSREFARVLAAAPPDTAIPSCPGWTLTDLARHLGGVHRWARSKVAETAEPGDDPDPGSRSGLVAWFETGADALVTELTARGPDAPCWTLYPPAVAATWARRQALETAIHSWDATSAIGEHAVIPVPLAVSGVAEVVEDLYPRQVRLERIQPVRAHLEIRVPDADGAQLSFSLGRADAEDGQRAILELSAGDALLVLWKRRTIDEVDVNVTGSESAFRSVLNVAFVP